MLSLYRTLACPATAYQLHLVVAVAALLLGGLIYLSNKNKVTIDTSKVQPANAQSGEIADHVFGKTDSKVVFVEYARKDKVSSTPTFYLNGKQVSQETQGDKTKLETAITDALKAEGIPLPATE